MGNEGAGDRQGVQPRSAAAGDVPAYTMRVNPRARHVRFNVTAREGLVVVVPPGLADLDPTELLRERREWIASAETRFAARRAELLGGVRSLLPTQIGFAATGERWPVGYRPTAATHTSARERDGRIVVSGAVDDAPACRAALVRWLQRAARQRLIAMLAEEAAAAGVSYAGAAVRGQRARWGGCTPSGAITLNRALLFLPVELVRAAIAHELAHLLEPNHSPAFYRRLERLDPEFRRHAAAIAASWDIVPAWAEP